MTSTNLEKFGSEPVKKKKLIYMLFNPRKESPQEIADAINKVRREHPPKNPPPKDSDKKPK